MSYRPSKQKADFSSFLTSVHQLPKKQVIFLISLRIYITSHQNTEIKYWIIWKECTIWKMYSILSSSPTLLNGIPLSMAVQIITEGALATKGICQDGRWPNSTNDLEIGKKISRKHLRGVKRVKIKLKPLIYDNSLIQCNQSSFSWENQTYTGELSFHTWGH